MIDVPDPKIGKIQRFAYRAGRKRANVLFTHKPLFFHGKNNMAVKVIERKTGEVIREIPPKELQDLAEKLDDMIGLIFSKKA